MKFLTHATLMICTLAIASCTSHDPFKPVASSDIYHCHNNRQLVISIRDNAHYAAISFDGRNMTLEKIIDDTDADAYSNNIYTLYYDTEENLAALEREGVPVFTGCKNVETYTK